MAVWPKVQRLWLRVRSDGPARAGRLAVHRAYSAYWEHRLGIRTTGSDLHVLEDEGLGTRDSHGYSPSSYLDLRRALKLGSPDPSQDVLIDIGSGKGRVVVMAAALPFRRVIGVELSPSLTAIAKRNLDRARRRLSCRDVEFVTSDAATYPLPDDVTVVYLYNPFGGELLARVVDNIRRSLEAVPRRLTIVSATPQRLDEAVAGMDWITRRGEFMGLRLHAIYDCRLPPGLLPA